jgi:two-component system, NarL family, invasion response regulator UvrY
MENILIADDHAVTRRGIRELVLERFPDATIVEAADGDAALEQIRDGRWNLILLDVMMPGPGILELIVAVRATDTAVPVLVLTASDEVEYVIETMRAGANGLIHKHLAADELIHAIERVAAGDSYLHADTAVAVAKSLQQRKASLAHQDFSARELEIFRRIALGQAIKQIGFDLGLSEKTVATYLSRIREKTGLISHVDIARYALKNGLVE